jgi:hypothetical protein
MMMAEIPRKPTEKKMIPIGGKMIKNLTGEMIETKTRKRTNTETKNLRSAKTIVIETKTRKRTNIEMGNLRSAKTIVNLTGKRMTRTIASAATHADEKTVVMKESAIETVIVMTVAIETVIVIETALVMTVVMKETAIVVTIETAIVIVAMTEIGATGHGAVMIGVILDEETIEVAEVAVMMTEGAAVDRDRERIVEAEKRVDAGAERNRDLETEVVECNLQATSESKSRGPRSRKCSHQRQRKAHKHLLQTMMEKPESSDGSRNGTKLLRHLQ